MYSPVPLWNSLRKHCENLAEVLTGSGAIDLIHVQAPRLGTCTSHQVPEVSSRSRIWQFSQRAVSNSSECDHVAEALTIRTWNNVDVSVGDTTASVESRAVGRPVLENNGSAVVSPDKSFRLGDKPFKFVKLVGRMFPRTSSVPL
jgi:hypothetical protein